MATEGTRRARVGFWVGVVLLTLFVLGLMGNDREGIALGVVALALAAWFGSRFLALKERAGGATQAIDADLVENMRQVILQHDERIARAEQAIVALASKGGADAPARES